MILQCSMCNRVFHDNDQIMRVQQGKLKTFGYDIEVHTQEDYCPQCFLNMECEAAREAGLKDE